MRPDGRAQSTVSAFDELTGPRCRTAEGTAQALAVRKISRLSSQDRADIVALARHGLIRSGPLERRAEAALGGYVGNFDMLRTSIRLACRIVEDAAE